MTIFHVIKYPLSEPYTDDEYDALPDVIKSKLFIKWWECTDDEFRKYIIDELLKYEGE